MSAETLQAIAGALDVDVADLRRDVAAEEWAKRLAELKDRYAVVDMRRIDSPSDVAAFGAGSAPVLGWYALLSIASVVRQRPIGVR